MCQREFPCIGTVLNWVIALKNNQIGYVYINNKHQGFYNSQNLIVFISK